MNRRDFIKTAAVSESAGQVTIKVKGAHNFAEGQTVSIGDDKTQLFLVSGVAKDSITLQSLTHI